jgi:hypothetical protein
MFGLLRPRKRLTPHADWRAYTSAYCNLCATLSYRYGVTSRMLVVHDVVTADWLLDGLAPLDRPFPRVNCLKGGVRSAPSPIDLPARQDFAAAFSAYAIGVKVADDLADRPTLKARLAHAWYRPTFERSRRCLREAGFDLSGFEEVLAEQRALERRGESDLARASAPSGAAFGLAARHLGGHHDVPIASEDATLLGDCIGRCVFLVDAYQDFARDVAEGAYNPLVRGEARTLPAEVRGEVRDAVRKYLETADGLCSRISPLLAVRWRAARASLAQRVLLASGRPDGIQPRPTDLDLPADGPANAPPPAEPVVPTQQGTGRRGNSSCEALECCACCDIPCCLSDGASGCIGDGGCGDVCGGCGDGCGGCDCSCG